jgi:RNA polymerase sigma-70 factor (ECF subfamily)
MFRIKNSLSLREFEKIFERLYDRLCFFANKYVKDVNHSEDIVQDVFIKVWEKKLYFENQNKTDGFFYTAVRNKCLDFLRTKYTKDFKAYPTDELEILQTDVYFMSEVVQTETSALIEKAINSLPDQIAKVMRLSLEGCTNKEIAIKMNISVNTVKSYKKNAYIKFRETLGHLTIE